MQWQQVLLWEITVLLTLWYIIFGGLKNGPPNVLLNIVLSEQVKRT